MKSIRLVIPDLFLPKEIARSVCNGLHLPALEKLLAKSIPAGYAGAAEGGLERHLYELFGGAMDTAKDTPIAAICARFDRLGEGCWLRADPVHLHLDQSRMLLSPVSPSFGDASALCASLNEHFAGQGMEFFAPHPQRWYLRTDSLPHLRTTPLSQVIGSNVGNALPGGEDAARWHGIFNEIQMLLYSHPVNDAREGRGELPVNSVWLWGGGCTADITLQNNFDSVSSDDDLPEMFAAGVPFVPWAAQWKGSPGRQLLVWTGLRTALQRGDLAGCRAALQDFEIGYTQPLWRALRAGRIARLEIDVLWEDNLRHLSLTRGDVWAVWRRARRLERYSLV